MAKTATKKVTRKKPTRRLDVLNKGFKGKVRKRLQSDVNTGLIGKKRKKK